MLYSEGFEFRCSGGGGAKYYKGPFNNYVDRKGWVVGQSNVYAYKINGLFLFTLFV